MKKSTNFLSPKLLALAFLLPMPLHAFYSPATGRWLSRDPIGEQGGINVFAFLRNSAVSSIDLLGLDGSGPWGPSLGPYCPCRCQSVDVVYEPGGDTMQLAPYEPLILGLIPFGHRYGCRVHVRWNVSGSPWGCKYYQDEEGTVTRATGSNGQVEQKVGSNKKVWQVYTDYQGIDFSSVLGASPKVTWTETVHWNVTFRCVSEQSGIPPVTKHDSFEVGPVTFEAPWW